MDAAEMEDPVKTLNELFAKRYTEEDEDYMKTVKKSQIPPPVITDWLSAGYRDRYQGHSQDRGSRYDNRDQGRRGYDRDRSHFFGERHAPYRRDDRYNRHDDRYGGRRNDRGYQGRNNRPSTEYGSTGYYEFFY